MFHEQIWSLRYFIFYWLERSVFAAAEVVFTLFAATYKKCANISLLSTSLSAASELCLTSWYLDQTLHATQP